jgi:NtrC-family two-component system response regulator AlgB
MNFLVIDDDRVFREASVMLIEDEGHRVESAATAEAALAQLREERFDAVLLDLNLGRDNGLTLLPTILKLHPDLPVVMFSAEGTIKVVVRALQLGAADFLEKPFTREQFHAVVARLQRLSHLGRKIEHLEEQVKESHAQNPEPLMDFTTPAMREVMAVLDRAAATSASVLILGESGTGKSVAARALHGRSLVADRPFVTVSCPSLSRELLESQLFGHVRGAFTGAMKDHWGKVKAAAGGTLFLDEIGDLPLEIQAKLLRLLQEREYERVGETTTQRAEVRVVAATNRDLRQRVAEGAFREDLFYRLNVIAVTMPPLRDRPEDLLRFADHYLRHFARLCGRPLTGFTDEAVDCLCSYRWPGNLRELRNVVERAVIMAGGERIAASDLAVELRSGSAARGGTVDPGAHAAPGARTDAPTEPGSLRSIGELEEIHIRRVLARAGSLAQAAQILGIDQATLYRKRKRLGIE